MRTSAPGNEPGVSQARGGRVDPAGARGFTLIELLLVLVLVALATSVVSLAVRDGASTRLEEEGARLAALLEQARAESRAAGTLVRWVPVRRDDVVAGADEAFRFVGLPPSVRLPARWLEPAVSAQVVGGTTLLLGPEAILPPQRVVLSLGDRRVEVATDGLSPFAVTPTVEAGR